MVDYHLVIFYRNFFLLQPQLFGWIGEKLKLQMVVFAILSMMAIQGVTNLQSQWGVIGEFSNFPQEELLEWIKDNTSPSESFCSKQTIF